MTEIEKDKALIAIRFEGVFYPIWKEFVRLSETDRQLNEVNFMKLDNRAMPIPVRLRNLIADYVKRKKVANPNA